MSTATATATAQAPAPPVSRLDFPTWLPAMLVKELRQGLRTRGFGYAFLLVQVLMAIVMAAAAADASTSSAASRVSSFSIVNGFYWAIIAINLLLITPGRALGGLQLEVSSRTIDLLMLTRLNAWRIVTAKWGSLTAQSILLLVAMLPYGIVRYFLGPVDLLADAKAIAALLGASLLLTAAGLWGAGMGKAFRVVVILVVALGSGTGRGFITFISRGGIPPGFNPFGGLPVYLLIFNGILLLLFFLVAAVRNIAPPAENHSLLARSLPTLALVPVFAMGLIPGTAPLRTAQLIFAGAFLIVVCLGELGSLAAPMAVHLRAARRLTAFSRVLLNMTLPGWPSAMLYATMATILWTACALVLDWTSGSVVSATAAGNLNNLRYYSWPWLSTLGLAGMLFPVVIISLLKRPPKQVTGLYFVMFGAAGVVLPLSYAVSTLSANLILLRWFVEAMPVASFVTAIAQLDDANSAVVVAQAVVALAVFAIAWWRARRYWSRLEELKARVNLFP